MSSVGLSTIYTESLAHVIEWRQETIILKDNGLKKDAFGDAGETSQTNQMILTGFNGLFKILNNDVRKITEKG